MRGARVEILGEGAPSSDPSGHLLPGGEKKQAAMPRIYDSLKGEEGNEQVCALSALFALSLRNPLRTIPVDLDLQDLVLRDLRPRRLVLVHA